MFTLVHVQAVIRTLRVLISGPESNPDRIAVISASKQTGPRSGHAGHPHNQYWQL
jgi:hypothetical protein